jgi:hypothetical protein
VLLDAERIIMRDPLSWEVARELERRGKRIISLSSLYTLGLFGEDLYTLMADFVCKSAQRYGPVVYALPGNPAVFEMTQVIIRLQARKLGLTCKTYEGMSCLDTMFAAYGIDPIGGLQICCLSVIQQKVKLVPQFQCLIFHIGAPTTWLPDHDKGHSNMERLKSFLLDSGYPPSHTAYLLKPGPKGQISVPAQLDQLESLDEEVIPISTLYLPGCVHS